MWCKKMLANLFLENYLYFIITRIKPATAYIKIYAPINCKH